MELSIKSDKYSFIRSRHKTHYVVNIGTMV